MTHSQHAPGARLSSGAPALLLSRRAALAALLGCCLPRSAEAEGALVELALVVAPGSSLTTLSLADSRRVFLSENVTMPDGTRIIPINHPPRTQDRVGFDQRVLGRDADAIGRYWIDQRIRGKPGPPRSVDNVSLLRRVVARLPGAVGYLRPSLVTSEVRAIRVDGKLPGEPGYEVVFKP